MQKANKKTKAKSISLKKIANQLKAVVKTHMTVKVKTLKINKTHNKASRVNSPIKDIIGD